MIYGSRGEMKKRAGSFPTRLSVTAFVSHSLGSGCAVWAGQWRVGWPKSQWVYSQEWKGRKGGAESSQFYWKEFILERAPEMPPPRDCAEADQMAKLPTGRELGSWPDSPPQCPGCFWSPRLARLCSCSYSKALADGKRIINLPWAHSRVRKTVRLRGGRSSHPAPAAPSVLCVSGGRMQKWEGMLKGCRSRRNGRNVAVWAECLWRECTWLLSKH